MPPRMPSVLTALDDSVLADQVRTAIRQYPDLRPFSVPRDRLGEALVADPRPDAVILDHPEGGDRNLVELIEAIRSKAPNAEILLLGERGQRRETYRAKLELGIFSFIPTPLDPIDLARRLHRLRATLRGQEDLV